MRWIRTFFFAAWAAVVVSLGLSACPAQAGEPSALREGPIGGPGPAQALSGEMRRQALASYRQRAAADNDLLSWLGPPPPEWSDEAFMAGMFALLTVKIEDDVAQYFGRGGKKRLDDWPSLFTCKPPDQFGPTPDAEAVAAYLAGPELPGRVVRSLTMEPEAAARFLTGPDLPAGGKEAWLGLVAAAKKGNWQARERIYLKMMQDPAVIFRDNSADLLLHYRLLQLMEWLRAHRIGGLYMHLDTLFRGDRPPPPEADGAMILLVFAALHGGYDAMEQLGRMVYGRNDLPERPTIGQEMRDCARRMMPALFSRPRSVPARP
ncbi:MAG: hypothetical protein FWC49_05445 [Proteobacteria bacterium]|nr:hypothetical protein [Pseudomonadota bacterium]